MRNRKQLKEGILAFSRRTQRDLLHTKSKANAYGYFHTKAFLAS